MNTIKARIDRLDFADQDDFLNIQIDGYWLDEKLDVLFPRGHYKSLVPTLDFALTPEEARDVVWSRILPAEGETTICPILMCPDDCDFSCTLLVAEIENWGNAIHWKRIGLNTTTSSDPDLVGSEVEWLYNVGALEFDMEEYLEMLRAFREKYEEDRRLEE